MYFLLEMGIFQPAMLVYQRVTTACVIGYDVEKDHIATASTHTFSTKLYSIQNLLPCWESHGICVGGGWRSRESLRLKR